MLASMLSFMRAPTLTLRQLLLAARLPSESRNAQAHRMGFSEGALRFYEHGGLPNGNTVPALARALHVPETKLRQVVDREREPVRAG